MLFGPTRVGPRPPRMPLQALCFPTSQDCPTRPGRLVLFEKFLDKTWLVDLPHRGARQDLVGQSALQGCLARLGRVTLGPLAGGAQVFRAACALGLHYPLRQGSGATTWLVGMVEAFD